MSSLAEAYAGLIDAALARPSEMDLELGALTVEERRSLSERYALDQHVHAMLVGRYPHAGLLLPYCDGQPTRYAGSMVLPSLEWLVALRDHDELWPRDWFPVSVTGDHLIQFLVTGKDGVFALHNDDFHDGNAYEYQDQHYASFDAFLRAATATFRHLRPEAFTEVTEGRWPFRRQVSRLRGDVVTAILADSCRPEEGLALLPQTGIEVG